MESEEKTNVTWNNLFSKSCNDGSFSHSPSEEGGRVGFSVGFFLKGFEEAVNAGLDIPDCERT